MWCLAPSAHIGPSTMCHPSSGLFIFCHSMTERMWQWVGHAIQLHVQSKNNICKVFVSQLNWFGICKCEKLKWRACNSFRSAACFVSLHFTMCLAHYRAAAVNGLCIAFQIGALATISNGIDTRPHSQNQSEHKQSETVTTTVASIRHQIHCTV